MDQYRPFGGRLERYPLLQCAGLAFFLNLAVEILSRRSLAGGLLYLLQHPLLFSYNVSIILATLLMAVLCRKRYFAFAVVSVIWLGLGVTNFVLLSFRTTPLAAIDFEIAESVMTIIDVYLSPVQLVLIIAAILMTAGALVLVWLKAPKLKARYGRALFVMAILAVLFSVTTSRSAELQALSSNFANIVEAYEEFGFAYCFSSSLVDRGIDKPENYSPELVRQILEEIKGGEIKDQEAAAPAEAGPDSAGQEDLEEGLPEKAEEDPAGAGAAQETGAVSEKLPNIVMVQLESFFDVNYLKDITFSENPVPNFTAMKKEGSYGFLTVPSIGGGTANTEFEVLTGMSLDYFGTGEYPFKTVLQSKTCESLGYRLKGLGYSAHAMHNNTGTFYDRNLVYPNLGFDSFTPLEYMHNVEVNPTGWAKDKVLQGEILKTLAATTGRDFVFAVSVQSHGKYPTEALLENPEISVRGVEEEATENSLEYYVNQIHEVDAFIGQLKETLADYPEPVVLVLYGDHLPSTDYQAENLKNANCFQTEYVIWSNRPLEQTRQDLYAYQLSAYLLHRLELPESTLGGLHKNYFGNPEDEGYQKALELLEYDMLYGEEAAYGSRGAYTPAAMEMGVTEIRLDSLRREEDAVYALGSGFTAWSKLLVNGEAVETQLVNEYLLKAPGLQIDPEDTIAVAQVCENLTVLGETVLRQD
ncbi:MAG: LTA synthase family protein [Peptococcaceae bacterium]|nr:LTA synthase family protein [Peptococcaceae bacterium]